MIKRSETMMFKVGENAVHLSHGVGVIKGIETRAFKQADGTNRINRFYILQIQDHGAPKKVFVPVEGSETRLRPLLKPDAFDRVFKTLSSKDQDTVPDHQTWNRRYREFMEMIHSGDTNEIARVLRALWDLKRNQDLSFGERKLLDQARYLLATEISLSLNVTFEDAERRIVAALGEE